MAKTTRFRGGKGEPPEKKLTRGQKIRKRRETARERRLAQLKKKRLTIRGRSGLHGDETVGDY
jgi:hypothetical protein